MHNFCTFLLLFQLVNVLNGEISLEILKNVKGIETVASDNIQEYAGRNLTLVCELVVTFNDTTEYIDDEMSWGWKHKKLQFNNITDLEKLAKNNSKLLYQFLDKSDINRAVKHFHPLFPLDSGTYFCMSLKYKLFKIVKLDVTIGAKPEDLIPYFKAMDQSRANFKFNTHGPFIFPKFLCTNDKFTCKSGSPCFDYQYVCDNVKDCSDGSDESVYLCGTNPCEGKKQCSGGRCVSESFCCDRHLDPQCTVDIKPLCCSESQDVFDRWAPPQHRDNFDYTNDFTDNVHWSNYEIERPIFSKPMYIATTVIGIIILIVIGVGIKRFCLTKLKNGRSSRKTVRDSTTNNPQIDTLNSYPLLGASPSDCPPPTYGVKHISLDNPPSYDQVLSEVVPPLEKMDA